MPNNNDRFDCRIISMIISFAQIYTAERLSSSPRERSRESGESSQMRRYLIHSMRFGNYAATDDIRMTPCSHAARQFAPSS